MLRKSTKIILAMAILLVLGGLSFSEFNLDRTAWSETDNTSEEKGIPKIPVKGMVTMVDLGAKKCIPCKMMAPILEELEKEYKDRAAIIFIDVWQHKDQAEKFKIKAIPTQIFFDKNGKEVERHTGFIDKKSIIAKLEKLGVK